MQKNVNDELFLCFAINGIVLSYPPQTVFVGGLFVGGYTVFTLSDRVSQTFFSPKRFCVSNILFL